MRFNFELSEPDREPSGSLISKKDVQWVPLQNHPVFSSSTSGTSDGGGEARTTRNLLAWDGASRLYFWDPNKRCLHRISIRLGDPDPASVLAAYPSKVLRANLRPDFEVNAISINRNGSALFLAGSGGVCVMYLYGRSSSEDNTILCRMVSVGSEIYECDSDAIRALRVAWHPYSDTHLGILSSDSVFRLFDLSTDLVQPEQEYYLQPVDLGRSKNAASIYPVDFSFGGDHLWDRFSVFVLFTDGSIYIICPIVPFGSVYKWESILEIFSDAQAFGLKSTNSIAVINSKLTILWLEATFPDLVADEAAEQEDLPTLKAHPYTLLDASLSLQGPLHKVCCGEEDAKLAIRGKECEGRADSLLYNLVSKDSVLVTAWSGGQLQIDALADEIQPVWAVGRPTRLRVDPHGHIIGLAMICDSISDEFPVLKLGEPIDHTVWLGHPPPLLRLAIVDLALPGKRENGSRISMLVDPIMPERIFSVHDGGVDSIVLHFLPFTNPSIGKDDTIRAPSVHPVISTCQGETSSPSPLCGFISMSDSFGSSWVLGVTSTLECIVLEMETWNLLLPIQLDAEKKLTGSEKWEERDTPDILSRELLTGPKVVLVPQASPNLRSIVADSIEGRSTLHQYYKLFHENYVEYAHKVHFELKHHGPQLKKIIDDMNGRLVGAREKLLKVEEKQSGLEERINYAVQQQNVLEQRLRQLRNFPGAHRRPLSRAEREFKSELDQFTGVELDALHSSMEALRARIRRYAQISKRNSLNQQRQIRAKNHVQDAQISQLKSAIEKLALISGENSKKVKLVESALRSRESSK